MDEKEQLFMKFATRAIHAGNQPDKETGAVMPPIYMTSTYLQKSPGESISGYEYTRAGNPNFTCLEQQLAALEESEYGTVFSSGLGALTALISTLEQGDKVVGLDSLYGGTYRLFRKIFSRYGIELLTVKLDSENGPKKLEQALAAKPKWLFFETPTNPLMEIYDIAELSEKARNAGALTIVDNTFATPYFQNPLKLGADVVWHSCTKYLGGHSDTIGGAALTNHAHLKEQLDFARKAMGLNPSPFDCWLIGRGVKTLAARMQMHQHNAMQIALNLERHPKVKKVYYPGLSSHPGHATAKKQMSGYGGIVTVDYDLPLEEIKKLISSYSLFTLAESLGGVESLVSHPATMTHASIPAEERIKLGITDTLFRYSIGIEDAADLIQDILSL